MIHLRDDILKSQIHYYEGLIAKHKQNVEVYLTYPVGIGEHPDIVIECEKLVKQIAEAREIKETVISLSDNNQNEE